MAKQQATCPDCPHLQAAGIDFRALFQQLLAKVGPIVAAVLIQVLNGLLGNAATAKAAGQKCPSGDCTDVCGLLDKIIENAASTISCAACTKALCNQSS